MNKNPIHTTMPLFSIFTPKTNKANARLKYKAQIAAIPPESKTQQSINVLKQLIQHQAITQSKKICVFINTNEEIDTHPIIKHLLTQGKRIYVPRCHGANVLHMCEIKNLNNLRRNKYGILEPTSLNLDDYDMKKLDVIVVPGLGFSRKGERLGHGVGYYDRFFAEYKKKYGRLPFLMGVGFKEQLGVVPCEWFDVVMDAVVVDGYC